MLRGFKYAATALFLFAAVTGFEYPEQQAPESSPEETGLGAKSYYSVFVDHDNVKWFLTELGIVSFNGDKWTLHNKNDKIGSTGLRDFACRNTSSGEQLWVVSAKGATVASLPFDSGTAATTYATDNSSILSDNVSKVALGSGPLDWFATDKGISVFNGDKWLELSYDDTYPYSMFGDFPVTAIATNHTGDTLYAATDGAGVARLLRNDVDGISGASAYAQWGPIIIPSDKVFSVYIAADGTKWFGTDQGVASHSGNNTLENWTVYTTDDGLANDYVQAITEDKKGSLWFGTNGGGLSVFNRSEWKTYTTADGLNSDNILCLTTDKNGVVWIGTDNGVNAFRENAFISYK